MSIRLIESAYATFFDDQEALTRNEMLVLQALAYCANENNNDLCYPSDQYIARLTHASDDTVERARKSLRAKKIISWEKRKSANGGNTSNRYTFCFKYKRMRSQYVCYESVAENPPEPKVLPFAAQPADCSSAQPKPSPQVEQPPAYQPIVEIKSPLTVAMKICGVDTNDVRNIEKLCKCVNGKDAAQVFMLLEQFKEGLTPEKLKNVDGVVDELVEQLKTVPFRSGWETRKN